MANQTACSLAVSPPDNKHDIKREASQKPSLITYYEKEK
jgi:hypothetical protein